MSMTIQTAHPDPVQFLHPIAHVRAIARPDRIPRPDPDACPDPIVVASQVHAATHTPVQHLPQGADLAHAVLTAVARAEAARGRHEIVQAHQAHRRAIVRAELPREPLERRAAERTQLSHVLARAHARHACGQVRASTVLGLAESTSMCCLGRVLALRCARATVDVDALAARVRVRVPAGRQRIRQQSDDEREQRSIGGKLCAEYARVRR
jgi:hypothetical protein